MKKRLAGRLLVALCALLLAVVASIPTTLLHAKPVQAVGAACFWSDNPGVVYTDWHQQTGWLVSDSWQPGPPNHWVDLDLWAYRLSGGNGIGIDGHCYRGYYGSTWTEDGSGGNFEAHIRAWVCGQGPWEFDSGNLAWGNRNDVVTRGWGSLTEYITKPNGQGALLDMADYGQGANCLPQADTAWMWASSGTWTPDHLQSGPGTTWYCHDRNGNFYCP